LQRDFTHVTMDFWARVQKGAGCWFWLGNISPQGYGHVYHEGIVTTAHRVAYELTHGPIPAKLWIDHLCRNRACVNPTHLEVTTPAENVLRGKALYRPPTCRRGHPFDGVRGNGRRYCMTCNRERAARHAKFHDAIGHT
jgi:hypothetical protein